MYEDVGMHYGKKTETRNRYQLYKQNRDDHIQQNYINVRNPLPTWGLHYYLACHHPCSACILQYLFLVSMVFGMVHPYIFIKCLYILGPTECTLFCTLKVYKQRRALSLILP